MNLKAGQNITVCQIRLNKCIFCLNTYIAAAVVAGTVWFVAAVTLAELEQFSVGNGSEFGVPTTLYAPMLIQNGSTKPNTLPTTAPCKTEKQTLVNSEQLILTNTKVQRLNDQ